MTSYIAFLRAVNVGGTGKLPMSDLKNMCESAGFMSVRTYIASGNVIFKSEQSATAVQSLLAESLELYAGKPVGVFVRTLPELADVLAGNPFPNAAPNRTVAVFLDEPPPSGALNDAVGKKDEEIRLGNREIYIHYGEGMGTSKLKLPAAKMGTARNMNTVAKLVAMAAEI